MFTDIFYLRYINPFFTFDLNSQIDVLTLHLYVILPSYFSFQRTSRIRYPRIRDCFGEDEIPVGMQFGWLEESTYLKAQSDRYNNDIRKSRARPPRVSCYPLNRYCDYYAPWLCSNGTWYFKWKYIVFLVFEIYRLWTSTDNDVLW